MKSNKKCRNRSSSSSSSSSNSSSSSSSSSSDSSAENKTSMSSNKVKEPVNDKTKRSEREEKARQQPRNSKEQSVRHISKTDEDLISKENRRRHRSRDDEKSTKTSSTRNERNYHHSKTSDEHHRNEKYRKRDLEKSDTKRERRDDELRSEGDRYKKYKDREDFNRNDKNRYHKYGNFRDRPRENEGGYRNYRRDNKYGRNRRDRSRSGSFDHGNAKWGKSSESNANKEKQKPVNKEKPNFGLSGKLTEETNTYRGVVIKYSEPPEARKPKRRWRLYPFKGEKALQTLYIHRESAYLIGRDRKVVDLPVDHPSCSKQHAVLQYRLVTYTKDDGSAGKRVRPYLIDLESANGTFINNKKIDPKKFVELLERDVIKFGFSSREYVLLHENSKDEIQDDDVKQEEEEVAAVKAETAVQ